MPPDADLQRFAQGLHKTRSGMRLRLAFHESRIALQQLERLRRLGGDHDGRSIASWRSAYIRACEHASAALDDLFDLHQWPPDNGRDRGYYWQPPRWQPRRTR